jgi:formylglycine-generating enzyme required for sulfatase activity
MRTVAALACAVLLTCLGAMPSHAEKRVALVIGNAAYRSMPRLTNPKNDAEDVGKALRDLGFETVMATDLNRSGMNDALDRFSRAVEGADIAIVYYSGHGMQFAGANYLLPVEARLDSAADVNRFRLMPVDDVLETLRSVRGARVLVLDACRNNPVEEDLKRQLASVPGANRDAVLSRGLVRSSAGNGLLIAYATQANDVASDGAARNSPFTAAFIKHVGTPDIDLRQMLFKVQDDVARTTAGRQRPELSISLIGEFKLKVAAPIVATPKPPLAQTPPIDPAERAWTAVKDTTSIAVLEDFIRRYGDSIYGTLARVRVGELKKSQFTLVVPPVAQPAQAPSPVHQAPVVPTTTQPQQQIAVVVPPVVPASPCGSGVIVASLSSRQAQPLSGAEECALKPKDSFKECDNCPEMVVVPAGSFMMGSPAREAGRFDDEGPQHRVTIGKPFAVSKFHATFDEFAAFVAETGYDAGSNCYVFEEDKWKQKQGLSWRNPGFAQNGSHPAVCLNWNDATAYVAWLAKKTGKGYRLLTEAQWEYAARAGTATRYFFGDDEKDFCRYGNGSDQTAKSKTTGAQGGTAVPCSDSYAYAAPAGSFAPNGFGLYDMHGNAWQWLEDCWHDNYRGAPSDGSAWLSGDCNRRVVRGGSWSNYSRSLRSASRRWDSTVGRSSIYGFRLGRTLSP